jgi:hypothetical protein
LTIFINAWRQFIATLQLVDLVLEACLESIDGFVELLAQGSISAWRFSFLTAI